MTDRRRAWPHVTVGAVADAVSLLLAAGAGVSFLLGHGGWTLTASCAALVAGAVALILSWRRRQPVAAAGAALVIAVGAAGLGTWSGADPAPAVTLDFDPQVDPVPYCRSYGGTGRIPDGQQVLLFDRATADVTGAYYFHGQAERTGHGWLARGVEIGRLPTEAEPDLDRGVTFDVYAQLVTEETARVLRDRDNVVIYPRDEKQPPVWLLRDLPGKTAATLRVIRGAAPGECD
ncbi:hypothetical protein [Symbioplanes lichenis]|uniref:hypothetical protein n=1 Tax=Symbioplanes lichenis TaxID=1629072 RepID=UPI00273861F4|nr:hypothetical protein [Actinoplanes lichenis]